jgi:hypothetical protein
MSRLSDLESLSVSWPPGAVLRKAYPNITALSLHWREEPGEELRTAGPLLFKFLGA